MGREGQRRRAVIARLQPPGKPGKPYQHRPPVTRRAVCVGGVRRDYLTSRVSGDNGFASAVAHAASERFPTTQGFAHLTSHRSCTPSMRVVTITVEPVVSSAGPV